MTNWWVAYNTSQQDRTAIGTSVGNPFSTTPSGYESLPSGNAADDAKFASAAAATKSHAYPAGKGPTISVENITWANVNGPYPSQAAANAAIPGIQSASPAPGAVAQAAQNIPGVGALTDVNSFLSRLTSVNTWIRVGEFVLGALLILSGTLKLTDHGNVSDLVKTGAKFIK